MRVLITGSGGQLAGDLERALQGQVVVALNRTSLDITVPTLIEKALDQEQPDVVINTAAYHQVDQCEDEPERSFAVNAAAVQRLAVACARRGMLLVHFSTDYVFDGRKDSAYTEEDRVAPLSVYGASKAAGEMAIRAVTDRHLIVRTTGLYGPTGRSTRRGNFVETMMRLAHEGKPISVVSDQVLTPSYTVDVAHAVGQLIAHEASGTIHVTNGGECSWYEFAREIFRLAQLPVDLTSTTQTERPAPARRPRYSVLAHDGLHRWNIPEPRRWQEALSAYLGTRETP